MRVLKLNGIGSWNDEISEGLDDDIEKHIMTGEIPEDIVEFDDEDEAEKEVDDGIKKVRKIGNMVVIFSHKHTDLIRDCSMTTLLTMSLSQEKYKQRTSKVFNFLTVNIAYPM